MPFGAGWWKEGGSKASIEDIWRPRPLSETGMVMLIALSSKPLNSWCSALSKLSTLPTRKAECS